MKKILTIYLIGVIIAWGMGWNHVQHTNKKFKLKTTYGDIGMITGTALLSWVDVIALSIIELGEADFWDTPIK